MIIIQLNKIFLAKLLEKHKKKIKKNHNISTKNL